MALIKTLDAANPRVGSISIFKSFDFDYFLQRDDMG
jgi:hypothetical protein